MMNRFYVGILIACLTLLLASCLPDGGDRRGLPVSPPVFDYTWMAIDPIQSMRNPWEQEWLDEQGGDPTAYPDSLVDQVPIIRDYNERRGIEILDIKTAVTCTDVCYTCDCPDGYTVWMKVRTRYANALTDMDFRVEDPPDGV